MSVLVSICIPVYNGIEFIEETIRSVQAQTIQDFELLIQDNCSTDGTWAYLEDLQARDLRVSIARNSSNLGMAGNWNAVIDRARGKFLLLLSADDLLAPRFLEECVKRLETTDCCAASTNLLLLKDGQSRHRRVRLRQGVYQNHADIVLLKNPFSINFTLYNREFLLSMKRFGRVFGPYFTCDYGLHIRTALSGKSVYFINEPLGFYRIHGSNLSRQSRRMSRQTALTILAYRNELQKACSLAYRITLSRFVLRAVARSLKLRWLDRRLITLLWKRMT